MICTYCAFIQISCLCSLKFLFSFPLIDLLFMVKFVLKIPSKGSFCLLRSLKEHSSGQWAGADRAVRQGGVLVLQDLPKGSECVRRGPEGAPPWRCIGVRAHTVHTCSLQPYPNRVGQWRSLPLPPHPASADLIPAPPSHKWERRG